MAPNVDNGDCLPDATYHTVTKAAPRKHEVVYINAVVLLYFHLAAIYGLYLGCTTAMWYTIIFSLFNFWLSGVGVVVGAHRLWSHRSFKVKKPLQIFLMLCNSLANLYSAFRWVRDHRLHHKFSDTDADPHNASRGLFFAHFGWIIVKKHPEVLSKGKLIDVSDIATDPVLSFQHRNRMWLLPLICFVVPTVVPVYFWGETLSVAWHMNLTRYMAVFNVASIINSFSHTYGYRPFDKTIAAAQNTLLFLMALGDGNHNFHHVFPTDYRSDELGNMFNIMAHFIDICAWLGLAYDLKTAPKRLVLTRIKRTGDGSHPWVNGDTNYLSS